MPRTVVTAESKSFGPWTGTGHKLHAQRASCGLRPLELDGVGRIGRMPDHRDSSEPGNDRPEQFQALAGQISERWWRVL